MQSLFGPVPEPGPLRILLGLIVGIGVPLAIAALMGKIVYDRLEGIGATAVSDEADAPVSDRWWWLVVALPVWFLLLFAVSVVLSLTGALFLFDFVIFPLFLLGFPLLVLAPVGVHFDRKYVAAVADWRPSLAYYLTFATIIGVLLAAIYVYERHEHVGVP